MSSNIINYLGENSYPGILNKIGEKLATSKSTSKQTNSLIYDALVTLNESITPMMDLKEFTTNAEKIAGHDATLTDILNFIKKTEKNGDMNYLVNMAKEEHFKEMSRTGFPNVQSTIKAIESEFNEPASVIEQGIKSGLFDSLSSKLLMDLKSTLIDDGSTKVIKNPEVVVKLNESQNVLFTNDLVLYNPIAIKMQDVKNNRIVLLTESDVLTYDNETQEFDRIDNQSILDLNIPEGHKKMMSAIQELSYNPEDNSFGLAEDWDFDMKLDSAGVISLSKNSNSITMEIEDVSSFLMESIQNYLFLNKNLDKNKYLKDADNMVLLIENHSKLIKMDNLSVIKNLNESSKYVIIQPNSQKQPKLIGGTGLNKSVFFDSYVNLNESCSEKLGLKLTGLFESQFESERLFNVEKFNNINTLMEEQKSLNESIQETDSLLNISDNNSPAFIRLNEAKTELITKLDENLHNLNFHKNISKLYS